MLIQGPSGSSCRRLCLLPPAPRPSPNIGVPLEPLPPHLAPASAQRAVDPAEPSNPGGGGAHAELRSLAQALVEALDALARMSPCHTRPPHPPHLH